METGDPTIRKLSRQYVGGVVAGAGAGLGFATVIYKYSPSAEIRDWMTIIAFILLVLGNLYAQRASNERSRNLNATRNEL